MVLRYALAVVVRGMYGVEPYARLSRLRKLQPIHCNRKLAHRDAVGWEPSTASGTDIRMPGNSLIQTLPESCLDRR